MYAFESKVRYSEVGFSGALTIPGVINYFQDCSTLHSDSVGYGLDVVQKGDAAWILSYWQILVERLPRMGELIRISTWPTSFKGFLGNRNFLMEDAAGNRLAYANSLWAYMDLVHGRPVRPPKEECERYGLGEPLDMPYTPRKIRTPENCTFLGQSTVRQGQIDTNGHMNNCQYIQTALDLLWESNQVLQSQGDKVIRQIRVDYKKAALAGDVILAEAAKEENVLTVIEKSPEGETYAVIQFTLVEEMPLNHVKEAPDIKIGFAGY